MKTILLILLALALISCETEEIQIPHTYTEIPIEPSEPPVEQEIGVPNWLIGTYQSKLIPTATPSEITEDIMKLHFEAFGSPYFELETIDVTITNTDLYCLVTYLNESIKYSKSSDPNSTDIKIEYTKNIGTPEIQTYHYGLFRKLQ